MRVLQRQYARDEAPDYDFHDFAGLDPDLVIAFASVAHVERHGLAERLGAAFPTASIIGCTTAGEITAEGVGNHTAVVTAIRFEHTRVRTAHAQAAAIGDSEAAGLELAKALAGDDLAGVLVFGKGVNINGSAVIDGMVAGLGGKVAISGGLAGDDGAFRRTFTLTREGAFDDRVVAVGFYGDRLEFGHGSFGGWQPFGPTRKITRADGNILHELDGEPALNLYKRYLGEYAKDLPASGLLFPFEMLNENHDSVGLIRTILGVNEADGSLVLAGAIEEGGFLRLMHASSNALVEGAEHAAANAADALAKASPERGKAALGILVSCVGRKLVLGDQVDEEVDAVAERLGDGAVLAGFYSYGEICPMHGAIDCKLHNQTMTITLLTEA